MKCPHCQGEIPGKECPNCRAESPINSRYCASCGSLFEDAEVPKDFLPEEEGFDEEERVLCPDGTCNGIIVDGKCTECGKPYQE